MLQGVTRDPSSGATLLQSSIAVTAAAVAGLAAFGSSIAYLGIFSLVFGVFSGGSVSPRRRLYWAADQTAHV